MTSATVTLFVTGRNRLSDRAQMNLRRVKTRVPGLESEVIDILEDPDAAEAERIVATPLLIRTSPGPVKRVFGDLSDIEVVISELDLAEPAEA